MSSNRMPKDWRPNPDDWSEFNEVIEEAAGGFMSWGEAERILRKLCASGAVQTVRFLQDGGVEIIPSKEWKRPDFDATPVYLNNSDLHRQWVERQTPIPEAGKQPRIKAHLAEMFPPEKYPEGVPDPAHCPRKTLKADLLKRDPGLSPLDEATLKSAIDAYNSSLN